MLFLCHFVHSFVQSFSVPFHPMLCCSPLLFVLFIFCPFCLATKHDKVPAGLRPAKALNEQQQQETPAAEGRERVGEELQLVPIPPATTILQTNGANNSSKRPLIFHKNLKSGRKNGGGPLGVSFAINGTETSSTTAWTTVSPPVGKDFGVNTILQTNLVDSQGHVLRGVSSVQLPLTHQQRRPKVSRASARQVEAEEDNAIPIQFSSG